MNQSIQTAIPVGYQVPPHSASGDRVPQGLR